MDRTELKLKLKSFEEKAKLEGFPLSEICIDEAYPGDSSTSYILKVKASWVDDMDCSQAIEILTGFLWETVDLETRKSIFSIFIHDSNDDLHCLSDLDSE